jgi:hypothetical protein
MPLHLAVKRGNFKTMSIVLNVVKNMEEMDEPSNPYEKRQPCDISALFRAIRLHWLNKVVEGLEVRE